jgi:flavin reductase (DIM6/NTAB) family NADH-FMN oxidoreductase RutF
MELDPDQLNTRTMYEWMIHSILPRPIAWVSTVSASGIANLAPFSFFQGVCARPPTLMFCPVNHRDGSPKDTLRNIEATGEFVVNTVSATDAEAMNATSAMLGFEESEFERFGIAAAPSVGVRPPRVASASVVFECRLDRIIRVSEGPAGGNIVLGRIVRMHVADAVIGANGYPDPDRLDIVGRMGGTEYLRTRDRFSIDRPA